MGSLKGRQALSPTLSQSGFLIALLLSVCSCLMLPCLLCSYGRRATVHVRVNDVNEFAPVFVERLYRAAVTEGKLYDRILRVEAIDGDCSPQYSQICYYEILTPNTPFLIDNDGEPFPCPQLPSTLSAFRMTDPGHCSLLLPLPTAPPFLPGTSFPQSADK